LCPLQLRAALAQNFSLSSFTKELEHTRW
jgi:hypothetical protein